jgi:hypothetical protein
MTFERTPTPSTFPTYSVCDLDAAHAVEALKGAGFNVHTGYDLYRPRTHRVLYVTKDRGREISKGDETACFIIETILRFL